MAESKHNQTLGKQGEELASRYLKNLGFKTIDRNFHTPYGEIDLIVANDKEIHFVEVKTRKSKNYGGGLGHINRDKQNKMARSAYHYLKRRNKKDNKNKRFSVVRVLMEDKETQIKFFPNAFESQLS